METTVKKKPKQSLYEEWEAEGQPCHYVRFHQPIPISVNKEPVSEFTLDAKQGKYIVDKITSCAHGVIWRANGELDHAPSANVMYTRSIQ
jgi:hypothetical protein